MLLGAYGPAAAKRVATAVGQPVDAAVEVIDRGELVLAMPREEGPTTGEQAGLLCVLDGEVTAAPWLAGAHRGDAACSPGEILDAWRRLGGDVVTGMRGRFVVVLWDHRRQAGLLIHDPTGLRGLFRAQTQGALVFASEIKQLLGALPQAPPPDPVALAFWLSNDNCWADRSFLDGVAPLGAGRLLELGRGGARERTWWKPRYVEPRKITLPDAAQQVSDAVTRSIASHARPTEEVGVLLSGGLDSGSVAALACRAPGLAGRITAYSAVFPGQPQTDEHERIEQVSRALALPTVQMSVLGGSPTAGVLAFIDSWAVPPPGANCFFWPTLIEHARSQKIRLLLGGEGGDELFGLSPPLLADRLRSGRALAALELARRVPGGDRQSTATLARYVARQTAISTLPTAWLRRLRRPSGVWSGQPAWLGPRLAALHAAAASPLAWRDLDGPRWWAYSAHTLTVGREIVGVSDGIRRLYERDGLRVHHPLLDPDVVELVLGLAPELAFDARFDRPLLRAAVSGLIPEAVRTGVAKSDFTAVQFAAIVSSDMGLARELLLAPQARIREFVGPRASVEELLDGPPDRHPGGRGGWTIDVWRLLAAECWLRAREDSGQLAALLERAAGTSTSFHLESRAAPT
jgi:asparagine synthase (glutamine-hydrolysing)